MRLVFAGTPEFARTALTSLHHAGHEIALVLNAVSFVPGGHRYGTYYGQESVK